MGTITMSAVIVTLFLGGPQPIAFGDTTLDIPLIPNGVEGTVWFLLKTFVFLYVYVWLRATLPRLRYDQLMDLGWKVLIPIALGWFLLLAAIRVGRDHDWETWAVIAVTLVVLALSYGLMVWAIRVSRRQREREGALFWWRAERANERGRRADGALRRLHRDPAPAPVVRRQAGDRAVLRWPRRPPVGESPPPEAQRAGRRRRRATGSARRGR
jgi:hypothetical protein